MYPYRTGVLNLYSLIYPLANFISRIYPQMFLYFFTSTNAYCIGSQSAPCGAPRLRELFVYFCLSFTERYCVGPQIVVNPFMGSTTPNVRDLRRVSNRGFDSLCRRKFGPKRGRWPFFFLESMMSTCGKRSMWGGPAWHETKNNGWLTSIGKNQSVSISKNILWGSVGDSQPLHGLRMTKSLRTSGLL